jgi:hypothetical protein
MISKHRLRACKQWILIDKIEQGVTKPFFKKIPRLENRFIAGFFVICHLNVAWNFNLAQQARLGQQTFLYQGI